MVRITGNHVMKGKRKRKRTLHPEKQKIVALFRDPRAIHGHYQNRVALQIPIDNKSILTLRNDVDVAP